MAKFKKGEGGRPKNARNKGTVLFEEILLTAREQLLNKAIELANNGEVSVLNKLLDKIAPSLTHNKNENTFDNEDFEKKLTAVIEKAKQLND